MKFKVELNDAELLSVLRKEFSGTNFTDEMLEVIITFLKSNIEIDNMKDLHEVINNNELVIMTPDAPLEAIIQEQLCSINVLMRHKNGIYYGVCPHYNY